MPAISFKNVEIELYLDNITDEELDLLKRVEESHKNKSYEVEYKGDKYITQSVQYVDGIKGLEVEISLMKIYS